MKKTLIPALVLVLGSVILGATVFREQVAWATPGIQDVFVTNSTREPVPVHEQGTADVNVTNTTLGVHEQGTSDVNVTNAPLAVRMSGEQPVQEVLWFNFTGDDDAQWGYVIPAGKYLRIEHVSYEQYLNGLDIRSFKVSTTLGGVGTSHGLPHSLYGNANSLVSESVRLYADPGSTVWFTVRVGHPLGNGISFRGAFSGVLIDAS